MLDHPDGFTVWYESGDSVVGVLTYNADGDYDLGEQLIAEAELPSHDSDDLARGRRTIRLATAKVDTSFSA
jgi:hypothetical protein